MISIKMLAIATAIAAGVGTVAYSVTTITLPDPPPVAATSDTTERAILGELQAARERQEQIDKAERERSAVADKEWKKMFGGGHVSPGSGQGF